MDFSSKYLAVRSIKWKMLLRLIHETLRVFMSMDRDVEPFEIDDVLRFENSPRYFDLEVYIKDNSNKKKFPLAPHNFSSKNKIYLDHIPTMEEWNEILRIYETTNEYSYCKYVVRIMETLSLKNMPELRNMILSGNGFSASRYAEIKYIASLTGNRLKLFLEKKIPVKYLRLLDSHDPVLVEKFLDYMLLKEINGNTVRDLANMWIDLDSNVQNNVHFEFQNVMDTLHKDHRAKLAEEFKKILFQLRYPRYFKKLNEIENIIRKLPNKIKINFDPQLENEEVIIHMRAASMHDITFLQLFFDNENMRMDLERIINKIRQ